MTAAHLLAPRPVEGRFTVGRRAFTLVELLAVLAIIGTLIGLLLPAVHHARELSRKTRCATNIRQTALGLCAYESARRRFPAGYDLLPRGNAASNGTEHAWSSFILPYIEEGRISDRIDYTLERRWRQRHRRPSGRGDVRVPKRHRHGSGKS
jgi:prepilin-type N-terminal cleavage/methylation domain-containing protein